MVTGLVNLAVRFKRISGSFVMWIMFNPLSIIREACFLLGMTQRRKPLTTQSICNLINNVKTGEAKRPYTAQQGQALAFIHYYTKIHGEPPAEIDLARYFSISPPAAHQLVVTLESRGLIERIPGRARSIRVLLARAELPDLE